MPNNLEGNLIMIEQKEDVKQDKSVNDKEENRSIFAGFRAAMQQFMEEQINKLELALEEKKH